MNKIDKLCITFLLIVVSLATYKAVSASLLQDIQRGVIVLRNAASTPTPTPVTDGYVYIYSNSSVAPASNVAIGIYDANRDLIGQSNSVAIPGTLPGWAHVTFTSGPTLTSSTTVYLGVTGDGYFGLGTHGFSDWDCKMTSRGTFIGLPATISSGDTDIGLGQLGIYVTAGGTTLAGNTDVTGYVDGAGRQSGSDDVFYYANGYTVN